MPDDLLLQWTDGEPATEYGWNPVMLDDRDAERHPVQLWVMRKDDVVYAPEHSDFGLSRESGCVKHTNLTGGEDAHSGGELRLLGENTVAINGASGRYGPRSEEELRQIVRAFSATGHRVFWTGYDPDTNKPNPLIGVSLRLAA